jgi:hypothetical protein
MKLVTSDQLEELLKAFDEIEDKFI